MCRLKEREEVCRRGEVWGRHGVVRQLGCRRQTWGERGFVFLVVTQLTQRLPLILGNYHHFHFAASQKCDPLERQLPVERQCPDCVVFHNSLFKRLKWSKQVCFLFLESDWFVYARGPDRYNKGSHFCEVPFSRSTLQNYRVYFFVCLFLLNISGPLIMHSSFQRRFLMFMQLQIHLGASPVQHLVFSGHWAALLQWF